MNHCTTPQNVARLLAGILLVGAAGCDVAEPDADDADDADDVEDRLWNKPRRRDPCFGQPDTQTPGFLLPVGRACASDVIGPFEGIHAGYYMNYSGTHYLGYDLLQRVNGETQFLDCQSQGLDLCVDQTFTPPFPGPNGQLITQYAYCTYTGY